MDPNTLTFAVAFGAGVVSFISPCVLPLIPVFLAYITGVSAKELGQGKKGRLRIAVSSALFVVGFSIIFALLGATAFLVGQEFIEYEETVHKIAGLFIIFFGLNIIGIIKIPALLGSYGPNFAKVRRFGMITPLLMGVAFGVNWTPCIGLELGAIFMLAAIQATAVKGALLLFTFGLGLGLPFIGAGIAFESFTRFKNVLSQHLKTIELASGLTLVALGILVFTGNFGVLTSWLIGKLGNGLVR